MKTSKIYRRHRYPASIISHCVWLYYRFTLSYRDIELIMMQKGISVTYESIHINQRGLKRRKCVNLNH